MKYLMLLSDKKFLSAILMLTGVIVAAFGKAIGIQLNIDLKPEIIESLSYVITAVCVAFGYKLALQVEPPKPKEVKDDK